MPYTASCSWKIQAVPAFASESSFTTANDPLQNAAQLTAVEAARAGIGTMQARDRHHEPQPS